MATMGSTSFEITINLLKLILIFLVVVSTVPMLVWLERRGSGWIQNRFGPNRIGPFGLTQLMADAVKFLTKEDMVPDKANKFLFYAAPIFAMIPGVVAFMAIPLSVPLKLENYTFFIQGFEMNIGIVFILGISSLAAYSILMAGWGSGSKFPLLGALRASAQTISYELALGLSIVGVIMTFGTFNLTEMVLAQQGPLTFSGFGYTTNIPWLPNWAIFYQPLAALIFFAATFAESNRLPFDLAEGEAELVGGFHTEYGGFKFNMFFIGEYGHMMVGAALMVVLFFGGYGIPCLTINEVQEIGMNWFGSEIAANIFNTVVHFASFSLKFAVFLWIFIHVRWTLPRFRYDQLMDLGWKTMLPWALVNTILTATVIYITSHYIF